MAVAGRENVNAVFFNCCSPVSLYLRRYSMGPHRFAPSFLALFASLALITMVLTIPALAGSEPVALRIFYSSNLYGEISPCG